MSWVDFLLRRSAINFRYSKLRNNKRKYKDIIQNLLQHGVSVHENFFDITEVNKMVSSLPNGNEFRTSPEGTQTKFYTDANQISGLECFFRNPLFSSITKTIIGDCAHELRSTIQIREKIGVTGAFEQFFHVDTWRHRIKFFLYLSDVKEENAPLIYVPESHFGSWKFKIDCDLYKYTIPANDTFLHDVDSQFAGSLLPHHANSLFQKHGLRPLELTGKAGTLIAFDARGLHRSKPLVSGKRTILSSYWIAKGQHT